MVDSRPAANRWRRRSSHGAERYKHQKRRSPQPTNRLRASLWSLQDSKQERPRPKILETQRLFCCPTSPGELWCVRSYTLMGSCYKQQADDRARGRCRSLRCRRAAKRCATRGSSFGSAGSMGAPRKPAQALSWRPQNSSSINPYPTTSPI